MDYSPDGLKLTQSFEGCRLKAYLDSVGVPTIGYGHTHGVTMGMTCTQEQADAWLQEDTQGAVQAVNNLVTVPLTQQQFDALVDFTFNLGAGDSGNAIDEEQPSRLAVYNFRELTNRIQYSG